MRKVFCGLMLLLGLSIVFSSCSKSHKDSEEEEFSIYGNWQSIYVQDMNDYGTFVIGNPYPTGEFKCKITTDEISGSITGEGSFKCSFRNGTVSQDDNADVFLKKAGITSDNQLVVVARVGGPYSDEWYQYTCQKTK